MNKPLRHDCDIHGGGVILAVKDGHTMTEVTLPDNPAEIIWGEVAL